MKSPENAPYLGYLDQLHKQVIQLSTQYMNLENQSDKKKKKKDKANADLFGDAGKRDTENNELNLEEMEGKKFVN